MKLKTVFSTVTHKKAKVLRVALNYMDMDLAKRIDFFDYISKYPPHYLFIENFGLNLDDDDSSSAIPVPIDAALCTSEITFEASLVWVRTITTIPSGIPSTLNPCQEMNFTLINLIVSPSNRCKQKNAW